ncbi:MAG: hypothetical protein ACOC8B_04115 [Gemmatimonadota bacterium]
MAIAACGAGSDATEWPEPEFDAVLEERWAVGGFDNRGGVTLETGRPWTAAIGPGGVTVVVDRLAAGIFLLGPDGEMIDRVGRRGSGPGEFQQPDQVGFLDDSLFWVSDAMLHRISRFDLEGRLVDTRRQTWEQVPGSPWSARGRWALAGGTMLGQSSVSMSAYGRDSLPIPLAFWDVDGELHVADWIDRGVPMRRTVMASTGVPVPVPEPVEGDPIIGVASDSEWAYVLHRVPATSERGEIRIVRYGPSGDRMDELEIPYRSVPVVDSIADWMRAYADNFVDYHRRESPNIGRLDVDAVREAIWMPDRLPPVRRALADAEGFWLQRERRSPREISRLWARYDLEGRLMARLRLPERVRSLVASAPNAVLASQPDSMGIAVVRMFDVTMVPRGEPRG